MKPICVALRELFVDFKVDGSMVLILLADISHISVVLVFLLSVFLYGICHSFGVYHSCGIVCSCYC